MISSPFRRMNSLKLIRAFLRGTRIATAGFAMATVGLAPPRPAGMDVAREAGLGDPPRSPGRRLADRCVRDVIRPTDRQRRFDRAEWVIAPPSDALRGGRPRPWHRNDSSGACRTSAFLTDASNSGAFRAQPDQAKTPPCSPTPPSHSGRRAPCDGRSVDRRRRSGPCRRSAAEGRLPEHHCRPV
jgi:hypothetical protein